MKTVFVSGRFNVLHVGHLRLLRYARERGDRLIVGVESDSLAGHNAIINERLRLEGVQSCSYVDEAFILSDVGPFFELLRTRVRGLGVVF
jgi:cytidyltransferase-like protein